MLSSTKQKINLGAFSISSSSSSTSSSSSSSTSSSSTSTSSSSLGQNRSQVTMEEVWKEINLGSLHHHRQLNIQESTLKNQNPNNSIFQDFLNMPLNQQQPPLPPSSSSIVTAALYGSPLPLPPPVTVLTLNSGVGFEFFDNTDTLVASNPHSFKETATFSCFGKKRGQDSDESRGDRRHKRMIKNRESAARSRARKQECAYTNELVLEIAHLQTENAKLKREQEQLKMAEATQHQVKKTLQRSSTAPF